MDDSSDEAYVDDRAATGDWGELADPDEPTFAPARPTRSYESPEPMVTDIPDNVGDLQVHFGTQPGPLGVHRIHIPHRERLRAYPPLDQVKW